MSKRYLIVEMSDGTRWAIPAMVIAEARARYYATHDSESGEGKYHDIYEAEIEYAISDDYELKDWASNNMNWEDVVDQAIYLRTMSKAANYHEDWINAPKTVQELEL